MKTAGAITVIYFCIFLLPGNSHAQQGSQKEQASEQESRQTRTEELTPIEPVTPPKQLIPELPQKTDPETGEPIKQITPNQPTNPDQKGSSARPGKKGARPEIIRPGGKSRPAGAGRPRGAGRPGRN